MSFNLSFKPYGERSILIEWPSIISEQILDDIILFKSAIEEKNIKFIIELKSAYNSLLITYDSICRNFENEVNTLKNIYLFPKLSNDMMSVLWKIPVCYDDSFGIDLQYIADFTGLSKSEIIRRHCDAVYTVYFIGFLPGFLYLGGLYDCLKTPRKSTPRLKVKKGSVGIGGNQTGIYPSESPGGWNIIGNSPVSFFDVTKAVPCFAKPGDKISFQSITQNEHKDIKLLVDTGVYQIENEVLNG